MAAFPLPRIAGASLQQTAVFFFLATEIVAVEIATVDRFLHASGPETKNRRIGAVLVVVDRKISCSYVYSVDPKWRIIHARAAWHVQIVAQGLKVDKQTVG